MDNEKRYMIAVLFADIVKRVYGLDVTLEELHAQVEEHFILYGIPGLAETEKPEIILPGIAGFMDNEGNIHKIR